MEVGMADAAGFRLDDNLTGGRRWNVPLLQYQRFSELFDDSGLHFQCHVIFRLIKIQREPCCEPASGCRSTETSDSLDHFDQGCLGVAVDHVAVIGVKKGIDDPGIAATFAAFDDIHLLRLIDVQDRHAENWRRFVGARSRIDDVICPYHQYGIGVAELIVDIFQLEDHVVRHIGFSQQNVHLTGHAPRHRVNCELHRHACGLQQLDEFVELLLPMCDRETVPRDDNDAAGIAHENARIAGVDRLERSSDRVRFTFGDGAEIGEYDVADRAVHGLGHQQREQQAGSADYHTGNHERRILQDKTFQTDCQSGQCVVDGNHDRHVSTAY